jgi:hypothetical protein
MILVDTSVLIPFLAGRASLAARYFERCLRDDAPYSLAPLTIQEVLQGARDEREWQRLRLYLETQLIAGVRDEVASYVEAARIYYDCRRRGLTVRSTVDCLVAQIALEHDCPLLHDDRDYEAIARVRPLKLVDVRRA